MFKPIKERLGLSAGSGTTQSGKEAEKHGRLVLYRKKLIVHTDLKSISSTADTNMEQKKASEQIRIKTLEEIRQEKAAKSKDGPSVSAPETNNTKIPKDLKRAVTVKEHSLSHVKTFSEILHAKKKRQEGEKQAKHAAEKAPGISQGASDPAEPETQNLGGVRVKTLEEIRKEKAARNQAQQAPEAENTRSCNTEENGIKKPRLLRIKKPASQGK